MTRESRTRTEAGWRGENAHVHQERQPFVRRARRALRVADLDAFPGLISELRSAQGVDVHGYYTYPLLFYSVFPEVSLQQLRTLCRAGSFLFDLTLSFDRLVDRASEADAESLFLCSMLQQRAQLDLVALFPPGSGFWRLFDACWDHFFQATLRERTRHRHLVGRYEVDELEFVYAGKAALGKACIAALSLLGGRDDLRNPMWASHDAFHVGYQLFDDMQDWRRDYQRGNYTYFVTRALVALGWERSVEAARPPPVEALASMLAETDAVEHTRRLALSYLDRAQARLGVDWGAGSWADAIARTRHHLAAYDPELPGARRTPRPAVAAEAAETEGAASGTPAPVASCWIEWLDPSRPPRVERAELRSLQRREFVRWGAVGSAGELLAQVGLAVHRSWQRYPEIDLADHLGMSAGELAWCRQNRGLIESRTSRCFDEPPRLLTAELERELDPAGWVPAGVGRYLGYLMARLYALRRSDAATPAPADLLRNFREERIA